MNVLLVEPSYYTRFPPLGLLKLAAYHKKLGDSVKLIRGCKKIENSPNIIYITSLFTWGWKPVWDTIHYYKDYFPNADVWLGGLYASLMPEHAKKAGADHVCTGLFDKCENLLPAYDLVPEWDGSILYTSRGCDNNCPYCAVWRLEGKINNLKWDIKPFIYPKHTKIFLWDNNILQAPNWHIVFNSLIELSKQRKMKIDFNQGLDARLIDGEVVNKLKEMKLMCLRLSYDHNEETDAVKNAIELLTSSGIRGRKIIVYVLYNWLDDPDNFFSRVKNVLKWGAVVFPMRYQPLNALEKNSYISPNWDKEKLNQFEKFRRVCGFAGTLPPYKWLQEKMMKSKNFDDAFQPPPAIPENTYLRRAHRDYYSSWARETDWRNIIKNVESRRW